MSTSMLLIMFLLGLLKIQMMAIKFTAFYYTLSDGFSSIVKIKWLQANSW